ncbi:MAG: Uma2 family endonuclease [Pyrinomonadaceae bacterium]|nr:Uma2 family endonuclease [Pyrinomonadaceae bacterium]
MNTNIALALPKKSEVYYPSEERKKMGETDYQHLQISILEQMLRLFLAGKKDVYLASDLIVYYEEGNANRRFAPDLMICFGVENKKRRTYKLWEEKVVPQVVIEVVSKETWQKDVTTKRRLYERLGVAEYFVIDPEYKYLPSPLFAYRLEFGELVRQSINDNRIFSSSLGLELVDTGEDFRFFNLEMQEFLPTSEDLQNKIKRLETEIARLKGKK